MTDFTIEGLQATVMQQAKALEKCSEQLTRLGFSANHADVVLSTTGNKATDTEILDRLFLELSQVTTASTGKELDIQQQLASRVAEVSKLREHVKLLRDAILLKTSGLADTLRQTLADTEPKP